MHVEKKKWYPGSQGTINNYTILLFFIIGGGGTSHLTNALGEHIQNNIRVVHVLGKKKHRGA